MSLFTYFMTYLVCISFYGVFFLRIFHYVFIYQDPVQIPLGCGTAVGLTITLCAIVGVIQKKIIRHFEQALKANDFAKAQESYNKFNMPVACIYALGFFVGVGGTNIIESITGKIEFDAVVFVIMLLQGIAVGFLGYTLTIYKVKMGRMADMLIKAGVRELNTKINSTLNVSVFACILLSTTSFMSVPIGMLKNPAASPMVKFSVYCAIAFIMTGATCVLCYTMLANSMQKRDQTLKHHLYEQTQTLADAAKDSAASGQEQSAAVKEIVATVEDNNNLSCNIQQKLSDVTGLANKSRDDVTSGIEYLQQNVKDLMEITECNLQTIEGIKDLCSKVANIWDIVTLITDVAAQAKIIAFNAELEASAAGPAGANFHIVATEVRRLSDNIIDSSLEVKQHIAEVQKSADQLIAASKQGSEKINSGYQNAKELEQRFSSIKSSSEATATASLDMNDYIYQMTAASQQILVTMKQIAGNIESFSQSTSNVSQSSESLKDIASLL